jgi:hypothetical protein
MGVTAGDDLEIGSGCSSQVGRHDRRRTPVEREWRLQHPSHADWHEICQSRRMLLLEDAEGIPVDGEDELGQTSPRQPLAHPAPGFFRG